MTGRSHNETATSVDTDFETALRGLVLGSFADGENVQGTWEIEHESSVVPDWRVTVEKLTDADLPDGTATFVDE